MDCILELIQIEDFYALEGVGSIIVKGVSSVFRAIGNAISALIEKIRNVKNNIKKAIRRRRASDYDDYEDSDNTYQFDAAKCNTLLTAICNAMNTATMQVVMYSKGQTSMEKANRVNESVEKLSEAAHKFLDDIDSLLPDKGSSKKYLPMKDLQAVLAMMNTVESELERARAATENLLKSQMQTEETYLANLRAAASNETDDIERASRSAEYLETSRASVSDVYRKYATAMRFVLMKITTISAKIQALVI